MPKFETPLHLEIEISRVRTVIERCKAHGRKLGAKAARYYLRELTALRANNYQTIREA